MPAGSRNYFTDNAVVDAFRSKVREWWSGVLRVRDAKTYGDKDLIAMRAKLLSRAYWIRDKIKVLITDEEAQRLGLDGLGVGPAALVWPVAIGAIVAYMAYQLKDFAEFYTRQSYVKKVYDDARSEGKPPEAASAIAARAADDAGLPKAEMTFFGLPVKWIALGAIGFGAILMFRKN